MTTIKKLNRIFDKKTKAKLLILLLAIIIGGMIEMVALALISPFLEVLLDNSIVHSNQYIYRVYNFFNFSSISQLLALFTFTLAAVYVFRGIYMFFLNRTQIYFTARMQAALSKRLLRKLLRFSYLYHTHKNIAEIQRIINEDVQELFLMVSGILLFLTDLFMSLFMLTYLLYASPAMTLCILALTIICVSLYFLAFRKRIRKVGVITRRSRVDMSKAVYQIFGGIKEVKVSKREDFFEKVYYAARDRFVRAFCRFKTLDFLPNLSLETVCFGGAFILLGVFIILGTDISALVPQLGLFVLAAFRILPAVSKQIKGINLVLYNRASVNAVYKSLLEEKDIAADITFNDTNCFSADCEDSDIRLDSVSFTYPGAGESVLKNVTFTIPENKSVALVGQSGVGKTTIADLVLGVLTPDAGTILFKGQPIYDNDLWSSSVGYIPQQIYLLDESILANVAFGIESGDIDEEKAWRALEQAQLKSFVETLPDGIHTIIGDRGVRLSGGQRQRVGIARAIYEDPPVLVLDEATSSLDNETEKAVMDAIMGFHGNKTILIVAHRLSTIEHCDIIYRVENKNIIRER